MELKSLSSKTVDIYVLWLSQLLPTNYLEDQSVSSVPPALVLCGSLLARPAEQLQILWGSVHRSVRWRRPEVEGCVYICYIYAHTYTMQCPCVHTVCWNICFCVFVCTFSSTTCIMPSHLGCFPVLHPRWCDLMCIHTALATFHMMQMDFTLRPALKITSIVVSLFFSAPSLRRDNSLPKAFYFISLSLWWILGCHAESPTFSIMLY